MAPTSRFPIQITVNIDLPGRLEAEALAVTTRVRLADIYRRIFFSGLKVVKASLTPDERKEFDHQIDRITKHWELSEKVGSNGGRRVKEK